MPQRQQKNHQRRCEFEGARPSCPIRANTQVGASCRTNKALSIGWRLNAPATMRVNLSCAPRPCVVVAHRQPFTPLRHRNAIAVPVYGGQCAAVRKQKEIVIGLCCRQTPDIGSFCPHTSDTPSATIKLHGETQGSTAAEPCSREAMQYKSSPPNKAICCY